MRDSFAALFGGTLLTLVASPAFAQDAASRNDWLDIEVGKSVVLETPRNPTAIAITNPDVANVVSLGVANKIQVQGISIGTTDLVVQYGPGVPPTIYEVTVHRDLSDLVRRVDAIVEGEPPRVYPLGERIVVEGVVDDLDTLEQVALVARLYDEEFVNLMQVRGDHQVQLEVLFAEVSRSGMRELGFNYLFRGLGSASNYQAGLQGPTSNPEQAWGIPGVADATGTSVGSSYISGDLIGANPSPMASAWTLGGVALINNVGEVAANIGMLDEYKLAKILAQPVLVSLSGQQAELLSGGEIPVASSSGTGSVTITYKEYGIKLVFVPTVLANDVIDVRVYLEISELDPSNSTTLGPTIIPGLLSRKADTHLRIQSGMTFAIAGLLSETMSYDRAGVPALGRIPILGMFFRNTVHDRDETETVIYVTPRLVRPLASGEVPPPPGSAENNNPSDFELFLLGTDARPGSRTAEPTGAVGLQR